MTTVCFQLGDPLKPVLLNGFLWSGVGKLKANIKIVVNKFIGQVYWKKVDNRSIKLNEGLRARYLKERVKPVIGRDRRH